MLLVSDRAQDMTPKHIYFAVGGLALASCQTLSDAMPSPNGPDANPQAYKALGTEPFWSLIIDGPNMKFSREREISVSDAQARPSFNGWRYTSAKITADVTFTECNDGMSEFTYKDTVTVMAGDKKYRGCGGGILPPETLERTAWQMREINAEDIPPDQGAMITFRDGRMSGSVGCNRLSASYTFADRTLSVGPVMSTRMACPDPVGRHEAAFVGILGGTFTTSFPGDGNMVLTGADGSSVVMRQSI